ncbi:MAG: hypothetical protein IJH80_05155 [Ruminococcus sp.]|nr:hypothetical protein [Ruminococcus sp.]
MGLFNKKNSAGKASAEAKKTTDKAGAVNAEDIWNTPVRPTKKSSNTVAIKESKNDTVHEEKVNDNIEPETIKTKMAELEKELEEKKNKPVETYKDFDVNPVKDGEVADAQEEYEKLYAVEHARYLESHKEDITEAHIEGIEHIMQEMYDEHDKKTAEEEAAKGNIAEITGEEAEAKVAELPYAKKPEDYPEYKDIQGVSAEEHEVEALGTIDHSGDDDEIHEVDEEYLANKVKEFNEKYGE